MMNNKSIPKDLDTLRYLVYRGYGKDKIEKILKRPIKLSEYLYVLDMRR